VPGAHSEALEQGQKQYDGTPCKVCGTTAKWTTSYSCVKCEHDRHIARRVTKNPKNSSRWEEDYVPVYDTKAYVNEKAARYSAQKKDQTPDDIDLEKVREFYIMAEKLTEETGVPHEVDHITPINKGGLHHQDNLQVLTRFENRSKGGR
jgi:5-methylcytosine-specific restriction endonuclease McrA